MEYLTVLRGCGKEQWTLLMVASLHGHDEIVRLLLTCDPSNEQLKLRGEILNQDQKSMNGVSALYCTCYRKHFHVAKTLIEIGKANVNETTLDYRRYPLLLHATINNRLDIVRFLVENRYVDVNETKSLNYRQVTALICAVQSGHTSLVQYLLDAGADVNYLSRMEHLDARTALVFAVRKDHLDIFVLLYRRGATINPSLLTTAITNKSHSILRFLLDESLISLDQLELAVSSLSWSTQIVDMQTQVESLKISLQHRQCTGQRKVCHPPLSIYDYQQECQTVDELESIVDDHDRIFIELVMIQDRLLPSHQREKKINVLEEYSLMLVKKRRFETCLDLCHHFLDLSEQYVAGSSLYMFILPLHAMLVTHHHLSIDRFLRVANLVCSQSDRNDRGSSLINALLLVILATQILQREETIADHRQAIYKWVQDLCRRNLKSGVGDTLLHLYLDDTMDTDLFFPYPMINTHFKFRNEAGLRLLLTCGGRWLDINARDSQNFTPLHIACRERPSPTIIELFLHHGCHLDSVDSWGRTAIFYTKDESIIQLLTPLSKVDQLKCLCVRLIAKKDLKSSLMDSLPTDLKKFVLLHDRHCPRKIYFS